MFRSPDHQAFEHDSSIEEGTSICLIQSDQTLYLPHREPANEERQTEDKTIRKTTKMLRKWLNKVAPS